MMAHRRASQQRLEPVHGDADALELDVLDGAVGDQRGHIARTQFLIVENDKIQGQGTELLQMADKRQRTAPVIERSRVLIEFEHQVKEDQVRIVKNQCRKLYITGL